MARVACDHLASTKILNVDGGHHLYHPARDLFARILVSVPRPVAATFIVVAVGTVQSKRRREKTHRAHELIHRNALEDLYVLEDVFRHRRALAGRWRKTSSRT